MIIPKKIAMVLLSVLIIVVPFVNLTASAESAESDTYNFDVVFVADGSGSMLTADPNKLVAQAIKEFFDVMDDSCRVGYVIYAHKIVSEHNLVSLSNTKEMDNMRSKLDKIEYNPNNDTDIALGLTEAMNILNKAGSSAGRKQMIVLLSDGNTDLPKGPRTVEESEKELKTTLNSLKNKNVRVYTIGLNNDGSLDTSAMNNIAKATGAKSYMAKKSSELQGIVIDIFADYEGIDPKRISAKYSDKGDGKGEYSAIIPINNNSVYLANIVINSNKGISNPKLTNPSGFNVDLNNSSQVKVKKGNNYMIVKIFSPEVGNWELSVDGVKEAGVEISLLESYTFYVDQQLNAKTIVSNSDITISASLCNKNGIVKDEDIISTVSAVCSVNTGKGEPQTVNLKYDKDGVFVGTYHIDTVGTYSFQTTIKAKNDSFEKVSKSQSVSAEDIWNAVEISQTVSHDTVESGEKIDVEAVLLNGENTIKDPVLLSNYTVSLDVADETNSKVSSEKMLPDKDGVFAANHVFEKEGFYKLATVVENNVTGDVKKSELRSISVTRATIRQLDPKKNSAVVNVTTFPRKSNDRIMLSEFFSWSKDSKLDVRYDPESSTLYKASLVNDGDEAVISFEGTKSGKENVKLTITDESGVSADLNVTVTVENGWKPFITAGTIILIVLAAALLAFLAFRSKLRGKVISISVIVPSDSKVSSPSKQELQLPNRHSANIFAILQLPQNSFERDSLREAVNSMGLSSTLKRIKLISRGRSQIDIEVVASENTPYIINNTQVEGKEVFTIEEGSSQKFDLQCSGNGHLVIRYSD